MNNREWVGFDLDGTLAMHDEQSSIRKIGAPIAAMVTRLKTYLAAGVEVRIFTARVGQCGASNEHGTDDEAFCAEQKTLIETWCLEHIGQVLPITATKDFLMIRCYDDRCVQVIANTGITIEDGLNALKEQLENAPQTL